MKFNLRTEDISYATLSYKDNTNTPCTVRIGIREISSDVIIATTKLKDILEVRVPQEILLKFVCADGAYHTKSNLIAVKNETPYVFFTINKPANLEYQQKREFFRIPAKYECSYKIIKNNAETNLSTETIDISAGGVSMFTPSEDIAKAISEITININNTYITSKVIYIRSTNISNGIRSAYQFDKLSDSDREYITQTCLKKQIEERRKNLK